MHKSRQFSLAVLPRPAVEKFRTSHRHADRNYNRFYRTMRQRISDLIIRIVVILGPTPCMPSLPKRGTIIIIIIRIIVL